MNLAFLDPLTRDALCEGIEDQLDDGSGTRATSLSFNPKGTMLAVGHHDGRCTVWDFATRQIFKVFAGHVRPVTSLSWSTNGRYLSSSSLDCSLKVWDMVSGHTIFSMIFESMVLKAEFQPKNKLVLLASIWMEYPRVIDVETKTLVILEPKNKEESPTNELVSIHTVASWDLKGDHIYTGNNTGLVTILDAETHQKVKSFSITDSSNRSGAAIKSFAFSRDGKQFLVNSTDKSIRLYSLTGDSSRLVRDAVDKLQWKVCHFFNDDYVLGCSSEVAIHKVYIWNNEGQVHKILEGPKESILDLAWHPTRTIFATCSSFGTVYIWGKQHTENWSAFAPDFTELEENEEYIEREDEFDEIQDTPVVPKLESIDENIDIDIVSTLEGEEQEDYIISRDPIPDSYFATPQTKGSPLKKKHKRSHKKQKLSDFT